MIYLLGGGQGFNNKIGEDFKITLKDKKSIIFIPTTPEDKEKSNKYKKINLDWFKDLDINFEESYMINSDDTSKEVEEKIQNKDVIFLMGGDPIGQLKLMKDKELKSYLKNSNAVIIGISAGALSICDKCIITKDKDYPENIVLEGLNLTNGINVEVHYDDSHDEDIYEIMSDNSISEVYGIPEDSAIKIDGNNLQFLGEEKFYIFKGRVKKEIKY
ncbi:Type 1 glutamine amidotransferase-like domain-containing protein [Dethiothermospora halolimnae]|uniref:Type 1 glutamine amidotransferase-like domain-containing protein n=1 Tax=Dethiothermospora halolimnae TaxID=3114390 RepID=UPI003CCBFBCF